MRQPVSTDSQHGTIATTDEIRFERLLPSSPHFRTLARWGFAQWGYLHPGRRWDEALEVFWSECGEGGVPSVFVALAGAKPVGMASLIAEDMDDRPELTPWLASVYVPPEWRGRGIASRLVRCVEQEAIAHGFATLHLFTPDRQALYRRLGWQAFEERDYLGERVTLMHRALP